MRRKKWVCLAFVIFILSLTGIFSNAEQDKRKRMTGSSHRDAYSLKNKIFGSRNNQQSYSFPSIENQPQYVLGEILVGFKGPLSDFDAAYLIGDYLYKRFGRLDSNWDISKTSANNLHRLRFPENLSVEQMIQIIERNPYVHSAEPNNIGQIPELPIKYGDYPYNELYRTRCRSLKEIRDEGTYTDSEQAPKTGSESRFYKTLKKKDKQQHKDTYGDTNLVGTDNNTKKIQPFYNKQNARLRAKIYKYRDRKGRLVITNCYPDKRNDF